MRLARLARLVRLVRLAPLALILAVTGCVVAPARPYGPPPARAAVAGPLTEQQAVDLAAAHARARGLDIRRTTRAFLDGKGRWHVDLAGPDSHASVVVDSFGGRILHARLRLGPPPPPPAPPPPGSPPGQPPGAPSGPEPRAPADQGRDDSWDE
jgi:hypothetical protein